MKNLLLVVTICLFVIKYLKSIYNNYNKNKIVIAIEGNIGVGKTTLLNYLKDDKYISKHSIFIPEPVDKWIKLVDNDCQNILEKYYKDKPRWSFSFQNLVYLTRMKSILDQISFSNKKYVFLDRSLGTDKNVFEKMLVDNKVISKFENELYNLWDDFYEKYISSKNKKNIIYLRCSPEIAYSRIQKRGRKEESNIDIDFLKTLHKYHESWIANELNNENNVLVLNYDSEFNNNATIQKIKKFIKSCS